MYGDEAAKLIRELKRFQDTLPPHNSDLVGSVQREMRHLYRETNAALEKVQQRQREREALSAEERQLAEEDGDPEEASYSAFFTIGYATLARNKRCLLAYDHHRMQHILRAVWDTRAEGAGQKPAPPGLRENMSAPEQQLFRDYARLLHEYKCFYLDTLDITGSQLPPKSTYIHVRALQNVEFLTEAGVEKRLRRGQMEMVVRADVERFIEQGLLVQV